MAKQLWPMRPRHKFKRYSLLNLNNMKTFISKSFVLIVGLALSLFMGSAVAVYAGNIVAGAFALVTFAATCVGAFVNAPKYALNTIGTVASGIGTSTSFNGVKGVPQALVFEVSTTPQSITVNINGRITTVFLDTAGINNLVNPRTSGRPATSFYLPISNGLMTDLTMDITIVNNVAAAFDLFAISVDAAPVDSPGFYVSSRQTINAGSIQVFDDFTYLALPNAAAADQITVLGNKKNSQGQRVAGGFTSRIELAGSRALIAQRENAVSGLVAAKVAFDNYNGDYQQINFQPVATQVAYVQRLVGADFRGLEVF